MNRREFLKASAVAVATIPAALTVMAEEGATAALPASPHHDVPGFDLIRNGNAMEWTREGWEAFGKWLPKEYTDMPSGGIMNMCWPNGKPKYLCLIKDSTLSTDAKWRIIRTTWNTPNGGVHNVERCVKDGKVERFESPSVWFEGGE